MSHRLLTYLIKTKVLNISLNRASQLLLALAIILLPFNSLPYLKNILREMSNEGTFYPLFIAIIIWGILIPKGNKFELPKHLGFKMLVLLLIWIFLSGAANFTSISFLYTKGRTGIEKLIFQIMLVVFIMLSALTVYNIVSHIPQFLLNLRRYVMISFLIAGLYSVIEIAFLSGNELAITVLQTINPLIHGTHVPLLYPGRLRSVSGEASWFAMYCGFISPWIFSYVFTERRRIWIYTILTAYLILIVMLTQSRTAYVITAIQLFLFSFGIVFANRNVLRKIRLIPFITAIAIGILVSQVAFKKNVPTGYTVQDTFSSLAQTQTSNNVFLMSNIARFGSQIAAINMAQEHPIFGVGLGQYGFYMPDYVPKWATTSDEIKEWMSKEEGTPWPPVHNLYARITAELGFVGLGIWLILWATVLLSCYKRYRLNNQTNGQHDTLGFALMVSIVGVLLSGLNADSFRFFGYWTVLGIAWWYVEKPLSISKS